MLPASSKTTSNPLPLPLVGALLFPTAAKSLLFNPTLLTLPGALPFLHPPAPITFCPLKTPSVLLALPKLGLSLGLPSSTSSTPPSSKLLGNVLYVTTTGLFCVCGNPPFAHPCLKFCVQKPVSLGRTHPRLA